MTYKELKTLVGSIGLPFAYYEFPDGTEQAPPFVCFLLEGSDDLAADNVNYQKIRRVIIELYTDEKDFALEQTVEDVLTANGIYYARDEAYIDAERMNQLTYEFDAVITDETD